MKRYAVVYYSLNPAKKWFCKSIRSLRSKRVIYNK